jgi:pilus assembly protein CpaD
MISPRPSPIRAALTAALLGTSALALAGCNAERIVEDPYPQRYDQRHPIVLSEGSARLDLPVGAGARGLTERQREDVRAFAADWRKNGRGPVGMMVPTGGAGDYAAPAIRTTLASAGVPSTQIVTRRYGSEAGGEVALVKLGYVKLKAGVPHPCGLWPDDMGHGGGDYYGSMQNRDYWNFGCASQQNLAAQVADPEDLARPRTETPIDGSRRSTVMGKYRQGDNPATNYGGDGAAGVAEVGGSK